MDKKLLEVLQKVQKELPVIGKSTEAFKYKYTPLDEIWKDIRAVIIENGFIVTNEITETGVLTIATHEFGELKSFIPFSKQDLKPQEIGSEITYYRRYNLTAIFNVIVAKEDDDAYITTLEEKDVKMQNNESEKPKKTTDEVLQTLTYEQYNKLSEADKLRIKNAICKKNDLPFINSEEIKQYLK
jgi:hypothetical protein